MAADAAWRVTGSVLRVSSCFYLACIENDWRAACWKLSWFPSVVLTRIMSGKGEYDIMILAAVQADLLSTTRHRQNSGRFGLLDSFLMDIFEIKSAKVEVWFQLEYAPEQLVSVVTANRHFYVATFFLGYPNLIICYLNMSYFRMIWTFALGKYYGRGALNRFLVVLILIETRAVLKMKVSPGVNIFMRWVFNFCLFWIFLLMVLA